MRNVRAVTLFVALLGFWQALSGRIDPLFATLGVISAAALTPVSLHLLRTVLGRVEQAPPVRPLALLRYVLWLASRIPPAGVSVALTVIPSPPQRTSGRGAVPYRTQECGRAHAAGELDHPRPRHHDDQRGGRSLHRACVHPGCHGRSRHRGDTAADRRDLRLPARRTAQARVAAGQQPHGREGPS